MFRRLAPVLVVCALAPGFARADAVLTFDENGRNVVNGVLGAMTFTNGVDPLDPTSPLRPLIYTLPAGVGTPVSGDVVLTDGGVVMDLIRFTDNQIIYYSDNNDPVGDRDRADVGITTTRQTNLVSIPEVNLPRPAVNGAIYTPTATQPGFLGAGTRYTIVSDGAAVPEPSTLLVTSLVGLGASAAWARKRLRAA
jgi:hypothetical protein